MDKGRNTHFSALDGTLHSFNFNAGFGDYGPTIILEHNVENQTFILYGHLSLDSLEDPNVRYCL
jgi:hypothetical protein